MNRSKRKRLGALVLTAALCACETSPRDSLAEAREALGAREYARALAAVEAGLRARPDEPMRWALQVVELEALARSGDAEATKALLAVLVEQDPDRVPPSEYVATAHQLRTAGQGPAAIEILDLGAGRFPDDPVIASLIGASATGSDDPAELEMLRSLGYIE